MPARFPTLAPAALLAALLTACGGGGGSSGGIVFPPLPQPPDEGRGSLVTNPPERTTRFSASQFDALLQADAQGRALLQLTGAPKCGIDLRTMKYRTIGGQGEATDASAALMVPSGTDAACSGARPIVLYAHGTTAARDYDLARFAETGQPAAGEGLMIAAMFAAQGYTVLAPNYAGYADSALPYHPYLNGDQQGKDMVDALTAARKALPLEGVRDGGALFVTGYSQGGYVAMAAHRELQALGQPVTASAPLSAPTAISLLTDYNFLGWPALGSTLFVPLLSTSWQKQFGDVYTATGDLYEARYANGIDTLLPSLTPLPELFAQGKLPQTALYPANAVPGPVDPALSIFYGRDNLVRQSYLTQANNDILAHPCPGNALPASAASLNTSAPLDCKPALGFRKAAVANDLRRWVPQRPVLMCGGAGDPTVNFLSTLATAGYFRASGMPNEQLAVLDLEEGSGAGDPYAGARAGFATAKADLAASTPGSEEDKARAVTLAYHGALVPPFCLASARGFFEGVLAAGG